MAADALAGARLIAVVTIDAGHTLTSASAGTTEWRVTTAPGVVSLIAHRAGAGHTLAKARLITVTVGHTASTGRSVGTVYAERCIAGTTGVGGHVTGHAGRVDALVAIAVGVAATPASIASRPQAWTALTADVANISPESRPSRVTRIGPSSRSAQNAPTKRTTTSGVKVSPTIPRKPETLMIKLIGKYNSFLWMIERAFALACAGTRSVPRIRRSLQRRIDQFSRLVG